MCVCVLVCLSVCLLDYGKACGCVQVEADGRLSEQVRLLSVRVERAEIQLEQEHQADRVKHSKRKLHSRISTLETSFREELQLIKQDYQSGRYSHPH